MTWLLLIRSKIVQALAILAGIALAILAIRRDASNDALQQQKEADNENADRIRDDVERKLDDRMRDYHERGYRD
jgi:hypothetical protein